MNVLIEATALADLIAIDQPLIVDCRYRLDDPEAGHQTYLQGHLPGAHYLHLGRDLSAPGPATAGRHPLPAAQQFVCKLAQLGMTADKTLVVYDDVGGQIAARLWWLCRWIGLQRVKLLNGGWQAWLADGGAVTQTVPITTEPSAADVEWASVPQTPQPGMAVTSDALKELLAQQACLLIDARSPPRYRGEQEPIDPLAGHIPGAINHPSSANLGSDGKFLPADKLQELFGQLLDGRLARQVVHSCGLGVTACHNLLAMEVAGLVGSRLFAPSWSGWIAEPGNSYHQGSGADCTRLSVDSPGDSQAG